MLIICWPVIMMIICWPVILMIICWPVMLARYYDDDYLLASYYDDYLLPSDGSETGGREAAGLCVHVGEEQDAEGWQREHHAHLWRCWWGCMLPGWWRGLPGHLQPRQRDIHGTVPHSTGVDFDWAPAQRFCTLIADSVAGKLDWMPSPSREDR